MRHANDLAIPLFYDDFHMGTFLSMLLGPRLVVSKWCALGDWLIYGCLLLFYLFYELMLMCCAHALLACVIDSTTLLHHCIVFFQQTA